MASVHSYMSRPPRFSSPILLLLLSLNDQMGNHGINYHLNTNHTQNSPDLSPKLQISPENLIHFKFNHLNSLSLYPPLPLSKLNLPSPNFPCQWSNHTSSCPLYLPLPPPSQSEGVKKYFQNYCTFFCIISIYMVKTYNLHNIKSID